MSEHTNRRLVVVEGRLGGMHTEHHINRLEMILTMMDNGAIGGGSYYGDEAHKAALARIEGRVHEVRETIRRQELEEAKDSEES